MEEVVDMIDKYLIDTIDQPETPVEEKTDLTN